jgi:glycosyltransferase involved in cell wall biosynthesis
MSKVSVLIPSRGEQFLPQTVADILAHAGGDVEVIAALDGYWPNPPLPEDKRLKIVHHGTPQGMRASINHAAAVATGDYLMKCDGHCMFAEGFDEVLAADIQDNQIVIPRRKRLDAENWAIQDVGKPDIDLHYLSNPMTNPDGFSMHGAIWAHEDRKRLDILIDETPSFQGSFWMMTRAHWERLGGMSEEGYGGFTQEPQEIGMKTWLGGGQVVVNKKTWYAHLHKGKKFGRGYHQDRREIIEGHEYSARFWMNNKWTERVHDFEWFIDKFPNMPTWDANWKEEWNKHEYNEHR